MKIHKTRFKELGYAQIDKGVWRFIDLSTGNCVGGWCKTKADLLAGLTQQAAFFGCDGLDGKPVGSAFEFDNLSDAGWIRITHFGDENVYFLFKDKDGAERTGFCKCL